MSKLDSTFTDTIIQILQDRHVRADERLRHLSAYLEFQLERVRAGELSPHLPETPDMLIAELERELNLTTQLTLALHGKDPLGEP